MKRIMMVMAMVAAGFILGTGTEADAAKKPPAKLTGVANLNQATPKQLDLLPGVGEKAAAKIVAYRDKTPFKRVEELVKVKGFGKKKFEKLKPYLAVSGPTTIAAQKGDSAIQARGSPPTR
jgi:competence protein ComEA